MSEEAHRLEDLDRAELVALVAQLRCEPITEKNILIRMVLLEAEHKDLKRQVELNTAMTQQTRDNTKQIVELLTASRLLVKILGSLVPLSKFLITVGSAAVFLYLLVKGAPKIPSINIFGGD